MKIILEYRKHNQHWSSFGPEIRVTTHDLVEQKMFGWVENTSDTDFIEHYSKFILSNRPCPETVSYATLSNLFDFQETGEFTAAQVPIGKRVLKVSPSDVALLSLYEYETCLNGSQNILEYEAILVAARFIEASGYEVRLMVFRK